MPGAIAMTSESLHAIEYSVVASVVLSAGIGEYFRRRIAQALTKAPAQKPETSLASVEDVQAALERRRLAQNAAMHGTSGTALATVDDVRSALERSSENRSRPTVLLVRRANVVRTLYSRLVSAERAWVAVLDPSTTPGSAALNQAEEHALQAANDFHEQFLYDRIYFPRHVIKALSEIDTLITDVATVFGVHGRRLSQQDLDKLFGAWTSVTARLPAIREELESEFSELLSGKP